MTFQIIIRGKNEHQCLGETRSEHEKNLRKEWGSTMTDEQLDKCKYLERKVKGRKGFYTGIDIDKVK